MSHHRAPDCGAGVSGTADPRLRPGPSLLALGLKARIARVPGAVAGPRGRTTAGVPGEVFCVGAHRGRLQGKFSSVQRFPVSRNK